MNRRGLAAVFVALVFGAGAGAIVHESEVTAPPDDEPWVDIMTYNVHQYWGTGQTGTHSIRAVLDTIQTNDPDIVGLQESEGGRVTSGSFDGIRYLADHTGFHSASGPAAREGYYGVGLLSRWPILDTEWHPLPRREGVDYGMLVARIDHPERVLTVAITLFAIRERATDRALQAEAVVAFLEKRGPLVLMGDFNTPATRTDAAYATLSDTFSDAWLVAGEDPNGGITEFEHVDFPARVDHIWTKGAWTVDSCILRGQSSGSDHRALQCRTLPPL